RCRVLETTRKRFVGRQVRQPGDFPQWSARLVPLLTDHQSGLPEDEVAVMFERGHPAENSFVIEVRRAPLQSLLRVRTGFVHDLAEMTQNRFGEVCRLRDVGIDSWIPFPHCFPPRRLEKPS